MLPAAHLLFQILLLPTARHKQAVQQPIPQPAPAQLMEPLPLLPVLPEPIPIYSIRVEPPILQELSPALLRELIQQPEPIPLQAAFLR